MDELAKILPHVNASLNALATLLLLVGWLLIKQRRETAHRNTMLAAFAVSGIFLACYLFYHFGTKAGVGTRFPDYPPIAVRYSYYAVLLTHVLLAMSVPVLTIGTIYFGLTEQRQKHRRWAKITFPIWLYVSVTGVVVYLLLYQIYPPR